MVDQNRKLRVGTTALALILMIAQRIYAVAINSENNTLNVLNDGEIDVEIQSTGTH